MNANHLIVGLGGTGGKIIRSFRKTVYQEFRKENPSGVNVAYLYIDSSKELMDMDDPSWKILGVSVQLSKKSQLLLYETLSGCLPASNKVCLIRSCASFVQRRQLRRVTHKAVPRCGRTPEY
jgi:hypothetical protein